MSAEDVRQLRNTIDYVATRSGAISNDGMYAWWRTDPVWPTQYVSVWEHDGERYWAEVASEETFAAWLKMPKRAAAIAIIEGVRNARDAALKYDPGQPGEGGGE